MNKWMDGKLHTYICPNCNKTNNKVEKIGRNISLSSGCFVLALEWEIMMGMMGNTYSCFLTICNWIYFILQNIS